MKKILFPTDFSHASINAFVYAIHLASKLNAEIIILHVFDLPMNVFGDYYSSLPLDYETLEWSEFENYKSDVPIFRDIAERNKGHHINLSYVLERGNPVDIILEVAESNHINFIVMGTKGASGIEEVLLGTVAEKVMNSTKIPVFAIPEYCQFKPLNKILFLTQFERRHRAVLGKLLHLSGVFNAHINVLEVKSNPIDDEWNTLKDWEYNYMEERIDFNIIESDDIENTILDTIVKNHIDLVAMTVKHKGLLEKLFLSSIARNIVFHSKIPVLAIPYE
ncbi:universal stress protein [Flavobacterium sp.]|uniref:universal stress protein n=1 Tax=Flavobacterium sp. TaxID=239 RepID=UPI003D6B75F8